MEMKKKLGALKAPSSSSRPSSNVVYYNNFSRSSNISRGRGRSRGLGIVEVLEDRVIVITKAQTTILVLDTTVKTRQVY